MTPNKTLLLDVAHLLALGAVALPALGCAVPVAGDDALGVAESPLTIPDPSALKDVPGLPAPPGYGKYCSVLDPSNGGWAFTWTDASGDPCAKLGAIVGPKAVVARAGLWDMKGNNNAMVQCDRTLFFGIAPGDTALKDISANVDGRNYRPGCVFTISPARLQVWGPPYAPSAAVTGTTVFDFDPFGMPIDVADFGMIGGDGNACAFDRTGFENRSYADPKCQSANPPAGQPNLPKHYDANEGAYDWSMAQDTPILAVADGIVHSQARKVWPMLGKWPDGKPQQSLPFSDQLEVYLETQVGTGQYAEHFVAAYHHMDASPTGLLAQVMTAQWGGALPPDGTVVKKGDVIGFVGETGSSRGGKEGASSFHLDLSVLRLTNLTGGRAYGFKMMPTIYDANNNIVSGRMGVNGNPGAMDPFGWAAAANVDPLSYRFMAGVSNDQDPSITAWGTFSINLWDTSYNYGPNGFPAQTFDLLPHNGGASW